MPWPFAPYALNLISSFIFSIFEMSFSFTGKFMLSYFTLATWSIYFEIRSGWFLGGNRNVKWHHLKHSWSFIFSILIVAFLFLIFSGNGRYEDPLSGLYLEMSVSCLSTDLITHPLPSDIHSLILLKSSLPASLITVFFFFFLFFFFFIFINYFPSIRLEANIHFFSFLHKRNI